MELAIRTPAGAADVTLRDHPADTTIGELIAHCTGTTEPLVVIVAGRTMHASTPIAAAGLVSGVVIDVAAPALDSDDGDGGGDGHDGHDGPQDVEIATLAGIGSGRRRTLSSGRYRLGPGATAGTAAELSTGSVDDPVLELAVGTAGNVGVVACATEAPERPGPTLDGRPLSPSGPADTAWRTEILRVSDRALAVTPVDVRPPVRRGAPHPERGTIGFNRPPRPPVEPDPPPLSVPAGGRDVGTSRRFPLLAVSVPIPIAVGMAALLGNWRYLLFGLLSPLMGMANWIEERRNRRDERARSNQADDAATIAFRAAVTTRFGEDLARRRRAQPTMADVLRSVEHADPSIWARRAGHPDAFHLPLGLADVPWKPTLSREPGSLAAADEIVADLGPLPSVPVVVDLANERGLGIVGDGTDARAVARAVVTTAATLHGPVDLDIVVCTTQGASWEWSKWLPHIRVAGHPRVLSTTPDVAAWARRVARRPDRTNRAGTTFDAASTSDRSRLTLVVADGDVWWRDRDAPLREVLADPSAPVRIVALTPHDHLLPAVCTTVLTLAGDGATATLDHVVMRTRTNPVLVATIDETQAERAAMAMASLEDADAAEHSSVSLPEHVSLLDVLRIDSPDAATIGARWRRAGRAPAPRVPIGIGTHGTIEIDMAADGPHALLAGTTGSGKSELLRSLVVGLAANLPPDELNIVLIDFKGGAAFDACARLPHTVALVTDLDEHLAGRVLRCLRAELTYRERLLRDAGVSDLAGHQRLAEVAPLPRLLLVIDEFALLAAELPEFLPALVDIAQRGRSLGLHMVLATQRPAGVVDAKITANTNLRIALRVQADADSIDVIGTRDASTIDRAVPGRAFARFGAGHLVELQTALSTAVRRTAAERRISIHPFVVGRPPTGPERRLIALAAADSTARSSEPAPEDRRPTELRQLVAAIDDAARASGRRHQRQPYPEPLSPDLDPHALARADAATGAGVGVPFALVDRPDEQRQEVRRWHPVAHGSLIMYGIAGAGTSSTLATLALGLARRASTDDVHLYVIDADANLLAPLDQLPHCGGVVRLDDDQRLGRVARFLAGEVERRRRLAVELGGPEKVVGAEPTVVVFVDNVGALRQHLEQRRELDDVWSQLELVVRDGRSLGIYAVVSATQERAVPTSMAAQIPERLVMRLGDPTAYATFGFRPGDVPDMGPGRALAPSGRHELQIVRPPADLAAAVRELGDHGRRRRPPTRIDPLPERVRLDALRGRATASEDGWRLPIGLDLRDAATLVMDLHIGATVVVVGPARSGRTSAMTVLAQSARAADSDRPRYAVAPRATALTAGDLTRTPTSPDDVARWLEEVLSTGGPRLVFVDDADHLDGPSFERLATARSAGLTIVLAGTPDGLRSITHWSRPLLRTRTGILLKPTPTDGDLLRTTLAPRLPRFGVGRGFVVDDGEIAPAMIAVP